MATQVYNCSSCARPLVFQKQESPIGINWDSLGVFHRRIQISAKQDVVPEPVLVCKLITSLDKILYKLRVFRNLKQIRLVFCMSFLSFIFLVFQLLPVFYITISLHQIEEKKKAGLLSPSLRSLFWAIASEDKVLTFF